MDSQITVSIMSCFSHLGFRHPVSRRDPGWGGGLRAWKGAAMTDSCFVRRLRQDRGCAVLLQGGSPSRVKSPPRPDNQNLPSFSLLFFQSILSAQWGVISQFKDLHFVKTAISRTIQVHQKDFFFGASLQLVCIIGLLIVCRRLRTIHAAGCFFLERSWDRLLRGRCAFRLFNLFISFFEVRISFISQFKLRIDHCLIISFFYLDSHILFDSVLPQ